MANWNKVVRELMELIQVNGWESSFETAIELAHSEVIPEIADIQNLNDYLVWINELLLWVPSEDKPGREINRHLCKFYFFLDQAPLRALQNPLEPSASTAKLTPLSAWMVRYAEEMGAFLDTPESITDASMQTFLSSPTYNLQDYLVPHGGWKSFNQFFARNFKPGSRPIAGLNDPTIIVSAADSEFAGQWEIRRDSEVTVKNLHWSIRALLEGSPYQDRFVDGMFMHAYLGPNDYHRQHTPVAGTVLEARVIHGQVFLDVITQLIPDTKPGHHRLHAAKSLDSTNIAGYQFAQSRGLIVIESAIGLVAILPIGMCQVSSVIITAEKGVTLRKGEEVSYFQFGGSDIIMLFEAKSNVCFSAQIGQHYKVGAKIAQAFPVV